MNRKEWEEYWSQRYFKAEKNADNLLEKVVRWPVTVVVIVVIGLLAIYGFVKAM